MKYALALLGLAAAAVAAPAGCSSSYSGDFTITPVNASSSASKRDLDIRQSGTLVLTLSGGNLVSTEGDKGYIASNHQFQFDNPPQAGALVTTGFSACSNGTLGLGNTVIFYACIAVDYYNFYDTPVRSNCTPIYFSINPIAAGSTPTGPTGGITALSDGQATATVVGQLTDHQPTATVVGQLTDHQPTATAIATMSPVGQLTDHQPTATAIATESPVGQLTDHQPTATAIATQSPVGQLTDHQPTATAIYNATATLAPYTGAAAMNKLGNEFFAIAAGVIAAAML